MQYSKSPGHSVALLNEYINQVDSSWNYYSALSQRAEQLANKLQFYRENIAIIRAGEKAFGRSIFTRNEQRTSELGHQLLQTDVRVHFRCGVIMLEEETRFKKTIFRITKGNSLVNCIPFSTIFDNLLDNEKTKAVFFVLFPGRQESYFESKVTRLVDNFSNKHYELPNSEEGFDPQLKEIEKAFLETESLLHLSEE